MWEYQSIELDSMYDERSKDYLNELGRDGWEAYSAFFKFPASEKIVVMLKRKIGPEESTT
jgi:hypothetical protein